MYVYNVQKFNVYFDSQFMVIPSYAGILRMPNCNDDDKF